MKTIKCLLVIAALAAITVQTQAGSFSEFLAKAPGEEWTLSLGGNGATTTTGDSQSIFGAEISLGRTGHLLLPLEAGLRQSFSYDSNDVLFGTKLYSDATLLKLGVVDLFAGANVGLTYGNTTPVWEVAPEAGLRLWIKEDVAILGRVDYPYDISGGAWRDTLRYFLGLQVKF